jgi:hypothetical protein
MPTMDGEEHMEIGQVVLTCDRDLSASIADSITQRTYAAPAAGWSVHRFGYDSWRDPYRTTP